MSLGMRLIWWFTVKCVPKYTTIVTSSSQQDSVRPVNKQGRKKAAYSFTYSSPRSIPVHLKS